MGQLPGGLPFRRRSTSSSSSWRPPCCWFCRWILCKWWRDPEERDRSRISPQTRSSCSILLDEADRVMETGEMRTLTAAAEGGGGGGGNCWMTTSRMDVAEPPEAWRLLGRWWISQGVVTVIVATPEGVLVICKPLTADTSVIHVEDRPIFLFRKSLLIFESKSWSSDILVDWSDE